MVDPMGGCPAHSEFRNRSVITALEHHPTVFVQFAAVDMEIAGMAVCFENYSTFRAAPFLNIHDLAVLPAYRGMGLATALLNRVILEGINRCCAKVTLEVRDDNHLARSLYAKNGFQSCHPSMEYLTRDLTHFI